jgi:hypothetical protein
MREASPFLVARGRRRGYRTILAPGFLVESQLQGVLSTSADGDATGTREVHVDRPEIGPMTLVYRTERVSPADLNGHGPAKDEHGRPLEIVYGLVCRGRLHGCGDPADLDAARVEALRSYCRFLADESGFAVDTSRPLALRAVPEPAAAAEPVAVPEPPRPPVDRKRKRGLAVPLAVALCGLVAFVALPAGSDDASLIEEASVSPPSGALDCSNATGLELAATIETEGPTDIVYHWRSDSWDSGRREVNVDGRQELPAEYPGASALPGPFRLEIERPEAESVEVGDGLRCAR